MEEGKKNLFPLYSSELFLYVKFGSLRVASGESMQSAMNTLVDLILFGYTMLLLGVDKLFYELATNVAKLIYLLADDVFLRETLPQMTSVLEATGQIKYKINGSRTEAEMLKQFVRGCAPQASPLNYGIYKKCLWLMLVQLIYSQFNPYIRRLRPMVLSQLYPKVARKRAIWLYNHILLVRFIMEM